MAVRFVWKIPIQAPPERLWRYIADTNRVNQYAGLPEFTFRYVPDADGGSRQVGETRYMGWRLEWDEHPFEWIEGQRFEVLRSYHNGPLQDFRTTVVLHRQNGGSVLEQTVLCRPRWFFVTPALYWELGVIARRRFEAAYRKIEQILQQESRDQLVTGPRTPIPRARVEAIGKKLANAPGHDLLPKLIDAVETLPPDELDRMRPFAFADRWKADRRETLKLFLHASQAGLLDLSWDLICPGCRGTPERHGTLRDVKKQAHCPACNIQYDADFAQSVEVSFRPNPAIRRIKVVHYCSGGPMNAPHVIVQQQIPARESRSLELAFAPRHYRLRSLQLQNTAALSVSSESTGSAARLTIHRPILEPLDIEVAPQFTLTLENLDSKPATVMIERTAGDPIAATAAMVIAMDEFRSLFSQEVLAPDTPISVGAVTLLFTDLKASTMLYEQIGEAPAYGLVRRHFDLLRECISRHDGALVKTIGDSVMAAFVDPAKAVEAAFDMHRAIAADNASRGEPALSLKVGIHHGPCIAVNLNDILDYFGTAVNLAARVQKESSGGDIVLTDELWSDPQVRDVVEGMRHRYQMLERTIRGLSGSRIIHRLEVLL